MEFLYRGVSYVRLRSSGLAKPRGEVLAESP